LSDIAPQQAGASESLLFHRLPNALHDLRRIVVDCERDGPLESLWARD
jgi:hypothetical protein